MRAAATRRRGFATAAQLVQQPRPRLVSEGEPPVLICLPSFVAGSGAHQFARLATCFVRRPQASALVLPGFEAAGAIPARWDAAIAVLAAATRSAAADNPFVLVGYSVGGILAHAVAQLLAEFGRPATGIVMVDTVNPEPADRESAFAWALGGVLDRDVGGRLVSDSNLSAMGAYLGLLDEWEPGPVTAPTLMVRARRRSVVADWPTWDVADTVVEVPADHFSILAEDSPATARAIEDWLPR
ncbi:thioesterase domain-containing protein [Nocardia halotolerans]|uniref:Thioesterase domain-containing protein n=1 Tax=Nocardia halotolerans TaxID=1755878 RepID=A0ABV8VJR6_9NOCA